MKNTSDRFTLTVQNYLKYRPSYPPGVIDLLKEHCDLSSQSVVADIGSGTGIFTQLLLPYVQFVYAVEPNDAMREAANSTFAQYNNRQSIAAFAEQTTLPAASIDLITVATAFHWFKQAETKLEFLRILKTPGYIALIWNVRDISKPLMQAYEELLLRYCPDYQHSEAILFDHTVGEDFFKPFKMAEFSLPYQQVFDWEGLKGRLLSCSYSLRDGDEQFAAMILALNNIFNTYQVEQHISFDYYTKVYLGRLK